MEVIKEQKGEPVPNLEFLRSRSLQELADMIRNRRESQGQPPLSEVTMSSYSRILRNMLRPKLYESLSDDSKTLDQKAQEIGVNRGTVHRYENVLGLMGLLKKHNESPNKKKILSALQGVPKSVSQISAECSISQSAVYRTIKILDSQELLDVSGTIQNGGKRVYLYTARQKEKNATKSPDNAPEISAAKPNPVPQRLLNRRERESLGELPIPKLMEILSKSAKSEHASKSEANLKNLALYAKRAITHRQFKHIANPFISNAVAAEKIGLKEDTLAKMRSSLIKLKAIMSMREAKLAIKPGREELITLIRKNPKITRGEAERLGFSYQLSKYFGANISRAKEEAKVPFVPRGRGEAHRLGVEEGMMRIVSAYSPVRLSMLQNLVPFDKNTLSRNLLLLRQHRKIAMIRIKVGSRGRSYKFYRLFSRERVRSYEGIVTDFEPKSLEKLAKMVLSMISAEAKSDKGMRLALFKQLRHMGLPPGVYELIFQEIKGQK
ncbi:MAG: ArsR family transcriptional regulator [Candidatus Micrarchaeota archaeon]|nr:ArsR family transcriptional regulator [Candidatus Micrarchaeota archaeon]